MAKLTTEARSMCPELIEAVKLLDQLAYSRSYNDVFTDFVDWLIWQHLLLQDEDDPLAKYQVKEQKLFLQIWQIIHTEVKSRVGMWTGNWLNWYDPLGRIYECITSKYKSSAMGQYFTPEPVVDMMVQITGDVKNKEVLRILDPACGSGRMGIASSAYSMANQIPCWITMNDLDRICAKMTSINMCMHGFVGEALCMNGLDITGESYRFGFRVEPALARLPKDMWEFYRMTILFKTGQDVRKQYVLIPVAYESTFLKEANDQLVKEYEEKRKIVDEKEKATALQEFQDKIQARMEGTLFENAPILVKETEIPKGKEIATTKKIPLEDEDAPDSQLSLF